MSEGWVSAQVADATLTQFAGGIQRIFLGSVAFAILFGVFSLLALRADDVPASITGMLCLMAGGNALSSIGLTTRLRWGVVFGVVWHFVAFVTWICAIFVAQGISGSPRWLITIGVGLTLATLFHAGAAIYLAYARRPNLRYRKRAPDPRYWGPHWVLIETPRAFGHPQGRFGGKLWIVFCLVLLSMVIESAGVWFSPGPMQIIGFVLHLMILLALVLRLPWAWIFTVFWAALSLLRGIAAALIAWTDTPNSVIWLGFGLAAAFSSVWVLLYMTEAARPNLVYRRRYRRVLDGEVF